MMGCWDSVPWTSLKTRSERSRRWTLPSERARPPLPRVHILTLSIASKVVGPSALRRVTSVDTVCCETFAGRRLGIFRGRGDVRRHQAAAATAADLPTPTSRGARLVRRPFVGGSLLVSRPTALARNLALLFRRHRRESAAFFAFCIHHCLLRNYIRPFVGRLGRGILYPWGTRFVAWCFRRFVRIGLVIVGVVPCNSHQDHIGIKLCAVRVGRGNALRRRSTAIYRCRSESVCRIFAALCYRRAGTSSDYLRR
jgi:hypothetical protein